MILDELKIAGQHTPYWGGQHARFLHVIQRILFTHTSNIIKFTRGQQKGQHNVEFTLG